MRRLIALALLALACLFTVPAAEAQAQNPFQRPAPSAAPAGAVAEPGPWDRLMGEVRRIQADLYRQLARAVHALKTDYSLPAAWGLVLVSLAYGVFHAIGPGHGKAVISAWLLANARAIRQGIVLAVLSSLAQAVTAIVLVYGGAWLFGLAGQQLLDSAWSLEQASFALIAVLGAWMLWRVWRGGGGHDHGHHHDHDGHHHDGHDHHHGHAHMPGPEGLGRAPLTLRRALPVIAAVGIRPCGGALIVLVFALANGLWLAGAGAVLAMSLGTAATVSVLAVLTLVSRQAALRLASRQSHWPARLETGLRIAGGAALLLFGVVFLAASIGQPASPFGI
ncbi:MAG: nickel/cobalt transporter [Pseudomonadota bacterium]|nr:nickel/cobalt transporter [Pseudomonadota bacterium]